MVHDLQYTLQELRVTGGEAMMSKTLAFVRMVAKQQRLRCMIAVIQFRCKARTNR